MEKNSVSKIECFLVYYLGFMTIAVNIMTVSVAFTWITVYGDAIYTSMPFVYAIPGFLIAVFTPKIIKRFSTAKITFVNQVVQIITSIVFILCVYYNDGKNNKITVWVVMSFVFISGLMFTLSQNTLFAFSAGFGFTHMQMFITGMSTTNLMFAVYILVLEHTTKSYKIMHLAEFSFVIFIYVLGWVLFKILESKQREQVEQTEMALEVHKSIFSAYKSVIARRWQYVLLNYILFLVTFIVYPKMMFTTKNAVYLMIMFGIAEVSSRWINTLCSDKISKVINEKTIFIIAFVRAILCIAPLFTFLVTKSVIKSSLTEIQLIVINAFLYFFIALTLGLLGNVQIGLIYVELKGDLENRVASVLTNISISFGIVTGSLISLLITLKIA